MNQFHDSYLHPLRKQFYQARIWFNVWRRNLDTTRAFAIGQAIPALRPGYAAAMVSVLVVGVIITISTSHQGPIISSLTTSSVPTVIVPKDITAPAKIPVQMVMAVDTTPQKKSLPVVNVPAPEPEVEVAPPSPPKIPDLFSLPIPLNSLPAPISDAPYTILVDKMNRRLLVLEETRDNYRVITSYPVELGAERGDKHSQGDLKTPEGLYQVVRHKEGAELPSRYGPGAFVLNYPNDLDRSMHKTGYGIWIHGSGIGDARKPTEGCVEVSDKDIVELKQYIDVGAAIYIFPENIPVPMANGVIQKQIVQPDTLYSLKEWQATASVISVPDETQTFD